MPRLSPEYRAHIKSQKWRDFGRQVKARDHNRCVRCGSRQRLEVDHIHYRTLGHERLEDCQTLCHRCHRRKTKRDRRRRRPFPWNLLPAWWLWALLGLLTLLQYYN